MSRTVRVIAGSLKGRAVPFDGKKFNNADITPQKVKEAVFSMLGNDLTGRSFLDLFGCSGQMAFEAVSRGAGPVAVAEADRKRYEFMAETAESLDTDQSMEIHNIDFRRLIKMLHVRERFFDIIYSDPPYEKSRSIPHYVKDLLAALTAYPLLSEQGILLIQHYEKNSLPDTWGPYAKIAENIYGKTAITRYRFISQGV